MTTNSLYVDTNILIYLLERHEPYSNLVADILEDYTKTGNILLSSTISITEFLAGTLQSDLAMLQRIPRLEFVALDEIIAEQAALLQRETKLHIGDSMHLATALMLHSEYLFTNDKDLAKIAKAYLPVKNL
jgi:predicted nucleic acid-binding protein